MLEFASFLLLSRAILRCPTTGSWCDERAHKMFTVQNSLDAPHNMSFKNHLQEWETQKLQMAKVPDLPQCIKLRALLTLTHPLDLTHSSEDGESVHVVEAQSTACGATFLQPPELGHAHVHLGVPHCHVHSARRVCPLDQVYHRLHHFCTRKRSVEDVGSRVPLLAVIREYGEAVSPERFRPSRALYVLGRTKCGIRAKMRQTDSF